MNDQAKQLRQIIALGKKENYSSDMKVITVASGKGGVGKSNFSVNLSLALKEQKRKPIILDADFGLANVEIILGEHPKYNLSHLLNQECTMNELIVQSKYGLSFISGGSGVRTMNFLSPEQVDYISERLRELENDTDLLVIDTGAGINDIVLKFCRLANEIYIVVTPEPTSITDSYALIKTLVSGASMPIPIKIVVNKAESKEEAHHVFHKLRYVTKQFLNLDILYAGFVPYDDAVFAAVKAQVPIVIKDKKAKASVAYEQISKQLFSGRSVREEVKENWLSRFKNVFGRHEKSQNSEEYMKIKKEVSYTRTILYNRRLRK